MIPLHDDNPTRRKPVVTGLFVAANVLVFLWQQAVGLDLAVLRFGVVPMELTGADPTLTKQTLDIARAAHQMNFEPAWATVLTSMFLHGGWMHLIGNMVFLAIFGNNIEDELGHLRFALFYLFCGVAAALAQVVLGPGSPVPMVGASGAIAGVLGGYYLLWPHARVTCLIFIIIIIKIIELPAGLVLGFWFLMQLFEALTGFGGVGDSGGVAYAAHIGGFIVGYLLMKVLSPPRPQRPRFYPEPDRFA